MDPDSSDLFDRWQRLDDREALEELLRRDLQVLQGRLRARARRVLRGSVSAEDLVHEAVVRLLRMPQRPQLASREALQAYLWRASWRLLLNRLRSRGRAPVHVSGGAASVSKLSASAGSTLSDRRDQMSALQVGLNLLESEDREALRLVYFEEKEVDAVAESLGVSRGTMLKRLSRARLRLAKTLRRWTELVDRVSA